MSDARVALLVGCSDYQDPAFHQLPAPARDVDAFRRVLADPTIGDFTVETSLDKPSSEVEEQIESFFADRKPDDLLLLYFSCHGVLDPRGRLYFVTTDTKRQRLDSTGISARWVKEQMDHSRSQRIVLLLDCCYSGAFTRGLRRRSAGTEEILEQLGGRGRVVITASDKMEYAYDSKFTDAVVRGLATGAADLDGDGQVSVGELYQYVYDQVRRNTPDQTPTMSADGMRGRLYLAKNPHALVPLPAELEQVLASESAWKRLWAVDGLRRLLHGDHPGGQKLTARQALEHLRDNDVDLDVRAAAGEALSRVSRRPGVTAPRRPHSRRLVGAGLALAVVLVLVLVIVLPLTPSAHEAGPIPCSPSARPADGVLSLGTLLPKTGEFSYSGPALDAGVHLAMKDINDAGGIPGIAVKLDDTNQRDEGNPSADTASQSADALLSGGVDVIIGPSTSAAAIKVIDKVTCAGVILFSPSNTSSVFTTYPSHGRYFRTSPSSVLEGPVLGRLVVADGNSTAVVISRDDVYGNYLREETGEVIQQSGGRVLDSFPYDPNAHDHHKDIQRIKAENPDAIVLIGFAEAARILTEMIKENIGPRNKRVYNPNMTNTMVAQVSPQNPGVLAGMKGTSLYAGDEAFTRRLTEASPGLQDQTYAAQAYDAVAITALAAAVAGTDEPAAVAKEINGVTRAGERCTGFTACMTLVKAHKPIAYDGASGPLRFTDHGEPNSATYVISEIQPDGTVKPLRSETVTPTTTPAPARSSAR
ncbi:MAG: ABC transporter substrate-binding protein [Pseudonocardiales bacterium]|nr:ABC transporter substrate-binding protein [Pseudonocardiales bacterium]MBV9031926.1 ABC transporter substrate-binding protein [Pseudonocardiales bacterium]MBW0010057.1 ABC transporter substrate-binding protein [Pseudonocardiales bacterium]